MTIAEAERILREAEEYCECPVWARSEEVTAALSFLLAELARKDEALRHLAGVAERAYGKALIEYRRGQPDARPEECWAEFEALGDVAAALGEQP